MSQRRILHLVVVACLCACSNPPITPSAMDSTVVAVPTSLPADGVTTTTLTITARDAGYNALAQQAVSLSVSGGSANVITPTTGTTTSNGTFTATLASTSAGMKTVSATFGSGLTAVTVSTQVVFTVAAAKANTTLVAAPASVVADGTTTTTLTLTAKDADGNAVPNQGVTLTSTGSNNTFTPPAGITSTTGVFTATMTSSTAETKTVTATAGLVSVSTMVTFTAGAASSETSRIAFAAPTVAADGTSTDAVTVTVNDPNGNPVSGVAVALASSNATDTLSPPTGTTGADGSVTSSFSTKTAGTPAITATIGSGSSAFTISAGVVATPGAFSATNSSVTAVPATAAADGVSLITLVVAGEDANHNPLPGVSVTLSASGTGNVFSATTGTLSDTGLLTVTLSSTVAQTETITAAIGNPDDVVTTSVAFQPGTMANAVFTVQPTNTAAGAPFSPVVAVALQDSFGNVVTTDSSTVVTVSLTSSTPGSTLSGTASVPVSAGIATFPGLSIAQAGAGDTLTVTATGYNGQKSMPFNVTPATKANAVFTTQPSNVTAGVSFSPAVVVTLEDAFGNTITSDSTTTVTLAVSSNAAGATLLGTATATAAAGIATFSAVRVQQAGAGYTLTATASGYKAGTSTAFDVVAGAMGSAVFATQPSGSVAGVALSPAVVVSLEDKFQNVITTDSSTAVTLALGTNAGATLSGMLTATAASGVAVFSGLSIAQAATGYTLTAAATGYSGATSATFAITAAGPAKLVFTGEPMNAMAGTNLSPAVGVTLEDAFGNTISSDSATSVTLMLVATGSAATLSGTSSVTAKSGVATFSNLSIAQAGAGYTLTATATGYPAATSAAFNVTPGPMGKAVFTTPPMGAIAGVALSPVVVTLEDLFGNIITTDSSTTVTAGLGASPPRSTLSGTASATAASGIATFSNLILDTAGTGYTLTVAATGYTGATSAAFNVTAGPMGKAVFTTPPGGTVAGVALSPVVVTLEDQFGNTITTDSSTTVTAGLGASPPQSTLSGTMSAIAASGIATFSNLILETAGTGYTLTAAATGYSGATSAAFAVTAAGPAELVFSSEPTTTAAGSAITPPVAVTVQDSFGNTVANDSTTAVTLALDLADGGVPLSGTATVTASDGVATFPSLSVAPVGTGYTLIASATGCTSAMSSAFSIVPGAPSSSTSTLTATPSTLPADGVTPTTLLVLLEDAESNVVPNQTVSFSAGADGGDSFSAMSCTTAADGTCSVTLTSTNPEMTVITATSGAAVATVTVTFTPVVVPG